MKWIVFGWVVLITSAVHAKIAPEFPEPHHHFYSNAVNPDAIGHLFNSRGQLTQQRFGVSFAHQNREWEYDWFLFGMVVPTTIGPMSIGYSNYGTTRLPKTKKDNIGISLDGYGSDTFEMIAASYQPTIKNINIQLIANYKYRQLMSIAKNKALTLDVHMASPLVMNNKVGIRTKNLVGTPYQGNNQNESLAKYVGVYAIWPISDITLFVEHDICLNYNELSMWVGEISMDLDPNLSLFTTIRKTSMFSIIGFGSLIKLSDQFHLTYANQNEKNSNIELSVHSISIGVTF